MHRSETGLPLDAADSLAAASVVTQEIIHLSLIASSPMRVWLQGRRQ